MGHPITDVPTWLAAMRAITGMTEAPGDADNPKILLMRDAIAAAYPEMADYCALYVHDETPWCGLTAAFCMTMAGIRPPFGATDTDRWMWALAWSDDSEFGTPLALPRLGCVVVMEREGGGHVTLYERIEGDYYVCRGGNQSDSVNETKYPISGVVALIWPRAAGAVPAAEHRELARGDEGSDVAKVQKTLGLPVDGDFGLVTEAGVKGYQGACGLAPDGVVGIETWAALDELDLRMAAGDDGITDDLATAIDQLVERSGIQSFQWPGRGMPPPGYYAGMCKTFALATTRLNAGDAAAKIMAQAATGDPDTDALTWYEPEFSDLEMSNDHDGVETLRHLFMLMIGLGMRESSGVYCEGRDMSADNVSSDTCEAGLFQTSWNISSCSTEIAKLLAEYEADPNAFLPTFAREVSPSSEDLDNYGSGEGVRYQFLAKYSPAFATLVTAIGLRKLRQHWGPINRREVDLVPQVDDLLLEVQRLVTDMPNPEPKTAEVKITIVSKGNVRVTVDERQPPARRARRLVELS